MSAALTRLYHCRSSFFLLSLSSSSLSTCHLSSFHLSHLFSYSFVILDLYPYSPLLLSSIHFVTVNRAFDIVYFVRYIFFYCHLFPSILSIRFILTFGTLFSLRLLLFRFIFSISSIQSISSNVIYSVYSLQPMYSICSISFHLFQAPG